MPLMIHMKCRLQVCRVLVCCVGRGSFIALVSSLMGFLWIFLSHIFEIVPSGVVSCMVGAFQAHFLVPMCFAGYLIRFARKEQTRQNTS